MKFKFKLFIAFFLLFIASAYAGKWTIDSFDDSPDPGDPDKYIDGNLKPVPPEQVSQQSGILYVRQKFEDSFGDEEASYQIFRGRPTEAAKNLGKISLDGIPYATLLKMKLFYKKTATGDDDLETVYFDGKDIFVEGEDPVYINLNGKMEELKPVVSKEYKISVTSEPSGATVTVNNASKGSTPVTFNVTSSKTITAVISKDGYYTEVKPITPTDRQTTQEGVLLTAKKPLNNPATAYKAELQTAILGKNASAIKTLRSSVKQTLDNYNSDSKKSIEAVMSKYPANPPKAASESSTDYSARQTIWTNAQSREREALNKEAQGIFYELKDLLSEIDAAAGSLDFTLKYEYIPSSAISFVNMSIKDFTINTELSNSRVKFNYSNAKVAYGSVPRNELAQNQESVHGVLKIWDNPNENGKFASIYDIAFFYDETPLKILSKGSFSLSEATPASRNTEKDLNSRIAKYSGKAEWDKKDEIATLKALRAGEIPDYAAAPKKTQPVEEAVYDEDEDEEEFDEEVEAQNEYDYSRYGATGNATQIFGNTDEYLFWASMAFLAGAVGTGVVGFLQQSKYKDADKAVSDFRREIDKTYTTIKNNCSGKSDPAGCEKDAIDKAKSPTTDNNYDPPENTLFQLENDLSINEKSRDSYKNGFITLYSAAAVSAAISITLYLW